MPEATLHATRNELVAIAAALEREGLDECELYQAPSGRLAVQVVELITRSKKLTIRKVPRRSRESVAPPA